MTEADLSQLCADIQTGWNAQEWLALARQARIAGAIQKLEKAHIEGIGQMEMRLDPYVFHSWGQKYGYQIWNDKQFRKEMMRDNPETKVTRPRRINKVGYGD